MAGNGDDNKNFAPGDVVLGKIKGYPPWPGIIVGEDNVPKEKVLSARPGKSFFIVRFFPAADYGFNKANELRKLQKKEIEAFLSDPHKKGVELREAYKLARSPEDWNDEQNRIVKQAEEAGEDEKDMLADDDDDISKSSSKKRKSSSGNGQAKKPRTSSSSTTTKKAPSKPASTSSTNVARKSAGAEDGADEEEKLDPEAKKVKSWRHALQRGFLIKDKEINPDEMEHLDKTMKLAENYNGITLEILRVTKIGKVMRRIVTLEQQIPRDGEFKFRERANKLCDKWQSQFSVGKESSETKSPAPNTSTSSTFNSSSKQNGAMEPSSHTAAKEESKGDVPAAADESVLSAAPN